MRAILQKQHDVTAHLSHKLAWLAALLGRVTVGGVFISSGWAKLGDLAPVVDFFAELGLPAPQLLAPFVAATEFLAGLLVFVGLATRLASLPLIVIMLVALYTARRPDIDSLASLFEMSEYLYIVILGFLCTYGAGPVALDYALEPKRKR